MLYNKLDLGGFWLKEVIVDQRTVEKERIPKFMDLIINVEKLIVNQKMIIEGLRIKHAWERRGKSRTKMKISQLNTLLCGSRTQVIRHAMRVRWMVQSHGSMELFQLLYGNQFQYWFWPPYWPYKYQHLSDNWRHLSYHTMYKWTELHKLQGWPRGWPHTHIWGSGNLNSGGTHLGHVRARSAIVSTSMVVWLNSIQIPRSQSCEDYLLVLGRGGGGAVGNW